MPLSTRRLSVCEESLLARPVQLKNMVSMLQLLA